jgi:hypothetical protein
MNTTKPKSAVQNYKVCARREVDDDIQKKAKKICYGPFCWMRGGYVLLSLKPIIDQCWEEERNKS